MTSYLRQYKQWSFLPVVVWILIQLAMTGLFAPASAAAQNEADDLLTGDYIIICTTDGFKRISVSEAFGEDNQQSSDLVSLQCEWCQGFGVSLTLYSSELVNTIQFPQDASYLRQAHIQIPNLVDAADRFYSRAPPA